MKSMVLKIFGGFLFTKEEELFVTPQKNLSSFKNKEIFTLGTSTRSPSEFLEILRYYQIELVIDVRRWPSSKKFPQYNKASLEKLLREVRIEYLHLEELGGFRKESYEEYMKSEDFLRSLYKVIEMAEKRRVCLICAERFPWNCHRRFIASALKERGFLVKHILELGRIYEPK